MSAPKRRIKRLRESGDNEMADWVEAREEAKSRGDQLWKWEIENPKPLEKADLTSSKSIDRLVKNVNDVNFFKDNGEALARINRMPLQEQKVFERIRQNKDKIKSRARKVAESGGSDTELKTLYKVIKRLDNEEKKLLYEYDFKAYDRDFFSDIQDRVDTADFHFDMVNLYNAAPRACVICPRGHAKSTTARKYILHQILYGKAKYVIIVGASEDMAAQNLRWVRDQLTDNDKVLDIFGWLKNKDKWADTEFQTNSGVKVVAKGAGQKIRGANEKGRPDLIYIDDLEEDEQVSSRDRREKLRRWFTQALLPAKSRNGRMIMTGTILHLDSLLKNISENKVKDHIAWQVLWYQAISVDEEGQEYALWEEHKPLEELRKLRDADPEAFAQEYQNNPTSGAMAVFDPKEYKYIDSEDVVIDKGNGDVYVNNKRLNILITTDLALSEREGADYTVFMVSGMDENSNLYVLEYERFRSSDPYEQLDMLFFMVGKWGADMISMEQVAFQKTFKRILEYEMEKRNKFFYIYEISRQQIRKIFRIKGLKAPIKAGKVFWMHDHVDIEDELSQVSATSLGKHDDVVDALADAWEIQIEIAEDMGNKGPAVNSVDWLIDQGMFPTVSEVEEMSLYGTY